MYKEIKKVKPLVEEVLKYSQLARNCDKELIIRVWDRCGLILSPEQRAIWFKTPSTESIRRTRQKIQSEGKYLADKQIREAREENRKNMEASFPRPKGHYCLDCKMVWLLSEELVCNECK